MQRPVQFVCATSVATTHGSLHGVQVLLRRNVYTGMLYKDDPTIMAYNLLNEHRCSGYEVSPPRQFGS